MARRGADEASENGGASTGTAPGSAMPSEPRRLPPLVLCYHAASTGWPHSLSVPPEQLLRQVRLLLRWYRPVAAGEVMNSRGRSLHVTFDDAYRSVADVLPGLRRLGVPATVFACANYADTGRPLDVSELAVEVATRPAELATLRWDELRRLAEDGVEIGSHTLSHAHLTRLDDAELARELSESRECIEDALRRPCRFLAYPYGEEDPRVRRAAREAGYDGAFALPGTVRPPLDPFGIPRIGVWRRDHLARLAAKIALTRTLRPAPADAA